MKEAITVAQAKQVLKDAGYQTYNLWHVDDIHMALKDFDKQISDEEAMRIIEDILESEAVISHIQEIIHVHIQDLITQGTL